MSSFFEFERDTNSFILAIQESPLFREMVKYHCTKNDATILAPQSVTLEGVNFTKTFVESHLIVQNPSNSSQFVTVNGVHGLFSDTREILRVISGPLMDQAAYNPLVDLVSLFAKNSAIFVGFDPKTAVPIHVLREGDLTLQLTEEEAQPLLADSDTPKNQIVVRLILISDPLVFPGCEWGHKARTLSPVKDLKPPAKSATATLTPTPAPFGAPAPLQSRAGSMMGSLIPSMPSMPSIPMPALYIPYLGGNSNNPANAGAPTPGSPTKIVDRGAAKGGIRDSLWNLFGSLPSGESSGTSKPPLFPDSPVALHNAHAQQQHQIQQIQQLNPRSQQQNAPTAPFSGTSNVLSPTITGSSLLVPNQSNSNSISGVVSEKNLEPLVRPPNTTSDTSADSDNRKRSDFFTKLKHPKAADLSKALKNFVTQMRARAGDTSLEDEAQIVRIFITDMEAEVLGHSLWNREISDEELDSIREGIEKCIIKLIPNYRNVRMIQRRYYD